MMLAPKPGTVAALNTQDRGLATAESRAEAAEHLAADVAQLAVKCRKYPLPRGIIGMKRRAEAVRTLALALSALSAVTDDRPLLKLNVMATLSPMPKPEKQVDIVLD